MNASKPGDLYKPDPRLGLRTVPPQLRPPSGETNAHFEKEEFDEENEDFFEMTRNEIRSQIMVSPRNNAKIPDKKNKKKGGVLMKEVNE